MDSLNAVSEVQVRLQCLTIPLPASAPVQARSRIEEENHGLTPASSKRLRSRRTTSSSLAAQCTAPSIAWFTQSNPDFDGSILVVERDPTYEWTSTSHTNSCIRQQFTNEINVRISQFGAAVCEELSAATWAQTTTACPSPAFRTSATCTSRITRPSPMSLAESQTAAGRAWAQAPSTCRAH